MKYKLTVEQQALVWRHRGLAHRIARHVYSRMGKRVDLDDLLQEGMIGIMNAAATFEPERGTKFQTHAFWQIRGRVEDYVRREYRQIRQRVDLPEIYAVDSEESPLQLEDLLMLESLVRVVPTSHREVLVRTYGLDGQEPTTPTEQAKAKGKTRSNLSRFHVLALTKMKQELNRQQRARAA